MLTLLAANGILQGLETKTQEWVGKVIGVGLMVGFYLGLKSDSEKGISPPFDAAECASWYCSICGRVTTEEEGTPHPQTGRAFCDDSVCHAQMVGVELDENTWEEPHVAFATESFSTEENEMCPECDRAKVVLEVANRYLECPLCDWRSDEQVPCPHEDISIEDIDHTGEYQGGVMLYVECKDCFAEGQGWAELEWHDFSAESFSAEGDTFRTAHALHGKTFHIINTSKSGKTLCGIGTKTLTQKGASYRANDGVFQRDITNRLFKQDMSGCGSCLKKLKYQQKTYPFYWAESFSADEYAVRYQLDGEKLWSWRAFNTKEKAETLLQDVKVSGGKGKIIKGNWRAESDSGESEYNVSVGYVLWRTFGGIQAVDEADAVVGWKQGEGTPIGEGDLGSPIYKYKQGAYGFEPEAYKVEKYYNTDAL